MVWKGFLLQIGRKSWAGEFLFNFTRQAFQTYAHANRVSTDLQGKSGATQYLCTINRHHGQPLFLGVCLPCKPFPCFCARPNPELAPPTHACTYVRDSLCRLGPGVVWGRKNHREMTSYRISNSKGTRPARQTLESRTYHHHRLRELVVRESVCIGFYHHSQDGNRKDKSCSAP